MTPSDPSSARPRTGLASARWRSAMLVATAAMACGAAAQVPDRAALPRQCIGDERLAVPAGSPWAWLDERDRAEVSAALLARFPQLLRDGLEPAAVLLWRHAIGDWRYAALVADPRQPGGACVAASFSGQAITGTAALSQKYFVAAGAGPAASAMRPAPPVAHGARGAVPAQPAGLR